MTGVRPAKLVSEYLEHGMTPEQAAEMYHLLAIARYEDRFVVPTSGRENHDDVWAMKGSEGLAQGEMEERT